MPNIEIEKEIPFKKLKPSERTELAAQVKSWFTSYRNKRQTQIDTAIELSQYIQLRQDNRNREQEWKSNIKENKIYTTWDSMKSVMWKEVWSNEGQMFDVVGTSEATEELAEKQKEAITYALKRMNAGAQYDKCIDYWGVWGDFIFKTDWKKVIKKVKRFNPVNGLEEIELPKEENACLEAINPMFFEFDVTRYKEGDSESFNKAIKIYKRFMSISDIKSNPLYTFTKEQENELTSKSDTTTVPTYESDDSLAEATSYGDLYEVLFLHGDFKFNGVEYKNVVAEVLAGEYLIYFDENPIYINPFVYGTTEKDEETGRGIAPLKSILELSKAKENMLNVASDIAILNANPPAWFSDSFLKEKYKNGNIEYAPGKVLEYENNFDGKAPAPIQFNSTGIYDIVSLLANDISDASSINANVMGNIAQGKRTATEMQLARSGSDSRIAMKLDKVYQVSIKVIENIAELLAMFKTDTEIILVKEKGQRQEVEITSAIRQANYQYIYEDRNALIDRRAKLQETFSMLNAAANNPVLSQSIDWIEVLKTGLEAEGWDNVDKFFKQKSEIDEIAEQVKQLPPELQQAIGQQVIPLIQQAFQYIQRQGQGQQQDVNAGNQTPLSGMV